MGPTVVRLERLLDLFGAAPMQKALTAALALPNPDVYAVQLLLDQHRKQLDLPPPICDSLASDSPLRSFSVPSHSLSSYDTLVQEKDDSHDPR